MPAHHPTGSLRGAVAPLLYFPPPPLKSLSVSLYERKTLSSPFAKGGLRGIQRPWQLWEGDTGGEVETSLLKAPQRSVGKNVAALLQVGVETHHGGDKRQVHQNGQQPVRSYL